MVSNEELTCRNCGARLKRYDNVLRIVRIKGRKTSWVKVNRFRCPSCGQIRRELPDYISPYTLPVIHRLFGVFILQKENQVLG